MNLEKQDWYKALVEECQAIVTEAVHNSHWDLIVGYHALGKRILEDYDKFDEQGIYGEKIVQRVGQSLGMSRSTAYYAVQFAARYEDLDKLPEGKSITWKKIITKYLPAPQNRTLLPSGKEIVCPNCSFKWSV